MSYVIDHGNGRNGGRPRGRPRLSPGNRDVAAPETPAAKLWRAVNKGLACAGRHLDDVECDLVYLLDDLQPTAADVDGDGDADEITAAEEMIEKVTEFLDEVRTLQGQMKV